MRCFCFSFHILIDILSLGWTEQGTTSPNPLFFSPLFDLWLSFSLKRHRTIVITAPLLLFISTNIVSNYFYLQSKPDSYKQVIAFLLKQGLTHAYSDYFIAYPITFLSNEKIIVSPKGGAIITERYPPYSSEVDEAKEVAYIFKRSDGQNEIFQKEMKAKGINFKEATVDDFLIYYAFSRKILPEEIHWS